MSCDIGRVIQGFRPSDIPFASFGSPLLPLTQEKEVYGLTVYGLKVERNITRDHI